MTTIPTRRPAIAVGLLVVAALGFRAFLAWVGHFGPADLAAYEDSSGIDLPDRYGHMPFFLTWSRGDGQAYMTIAADPFLQGPSRNLIAPVYRFGRAGYPLLARMVALGEPGLLPIGLLTVNIVAMATYSTFVMHATKRHPKAIWLLANPALLVGLATDTAEPLAFALLILALGSGSWVAALAATALGVVRESYATVLGIGRRPGLMIAAGAVSALGIRLAAGATLGQSPFEGSSIFTWPIAGYLKGFDSQPWPKAALSLLLLAAMVATFIRGFLVRGAWVRLSWWSTGLLGLCLAEVVTNDVLNVVRALGAVPLLWVLQSPETNSRPIEAPA